MADYTHKNLMSVEDSAPGIGLSKCQESRFATGDLDVWRDKIESNEDELA